MIARVRNRSLPEVMRACATAAADRGNRTPGVIPQPGPHWRGDTDLPPVKIPLAELCIDCGKAAGLSHPKDHPWRSLKGKPQATGYDSPHVAEARAHAHAALANDRPAMAAARRPIVALPERGVAKDPEAGAGSAP